MADPVEVIIPTQQIIIKNMLSDLLDNKIFGQIDIQVGLEQGKAIVDVLMTIEEKLKPKPSDPFSFENIIFDFIIPSIPYINIVGKGISSFKAIASISSFFDRVEKDHKDMFTSFYEGAIKSVIKSKSKQILSNLTYDSPNESFSQNYGTNHKVTLKEIFLNADKINSIFPKRDPSATNLSHDDFITIINKSPNVPPDLSELLKKFSLELADVADDFLGNVYQISNNSSATPLTLGLIGFENIRKIINEIKTQANDLKDRINDWISTIDDPYWLLTITQFIDRVSNYKGSAREKLFRDITTAFIQEYQKCVWFSDHVIYYDINIGLPQPIFEDEEAGRQVSLNMIKNYRKVLAENWKIDIFKNNLKWNLMLKVLDKNRPSTGSDFLDTWSSAFTMFIDVFDEDKDKRQYTREIKFEIVQDENNNDKLYYALSQQIFYNNDVGSLFLFTNLLLFEIGYNGKSGNKFLKNLIQKIIKSKYDNNFRKIPMSISSISMVDSSNKKIQRINKTFSFITP